MGGGGVLPPPIPMFFGGSGGGGRAKKLKKAIEEKTYSPSLTAQIVQETPVMITEAQAQKLLQHSFTGFEYRPSVQIMKSGAKVKKGYTIPKSILNPKVTGLKNKMQTQRKSNVRNKINTKTNTKINFNPKIKGMGTNKSKKINFNPKVKTNTLF